MQEQGLAMHGSALPVADTIRDTARGTGPVILMIHGYKFEPGHPDHCPHAHIFSLRSDHANWGWTDRRRDGLASPLAGPRADRSGRPMHRLRRPGARWPT